MSHKDNLGNRTNLSLSSSDQAGNPETAKPGKAACSMGLWLWPSASPSHPIPSSSRRFVSIVPPKPNPAAVYNNCQLKTSLQRAPQPAAGHKRQSALVTKVCALFAVSTQSARAHITNHVCVGEGVNRIGSTKLTPCEITLPDPGPAVTHHYRRRHTRRPDIRLCEWEHASRTQSPNSSWLLVGASPRK